MGILEKFRFKKQKQTRYYETLGSRGSAISTYSGSIYNQELTRSAIDRFATACSKFYPEVVGNARPSVQKLFRTSPNPYTTWQQFLYRAATATMCVNNCFIVPSFAEDMQTIASFQLICQEGTTHTVVEAEDGEPWFRFNLPTGRVVASRVVDTITLTRFQYGSDFFGEPGVLDQTMSLIDAQNKAQDAAIKNGSTIRFIGQVSSMMHEEELEKKRERFAKSNLSSDNDSGLMIYDTSFSDIKQIQSASYVMGAEEMARIRENVCSYTGVSEAILFNRYTEEEWNAFYESMCEPFALQLGLGFTKVCFTPREQLTNSITFSSNRLQYASNKTKLDYTTSMYDRGLLSGDQVMDVWNLPHFEGGDKRVIRGEYIDASLLSEHTLDDALRYLGVDSDTDEQDKEQDNGED